MCSSLTPGKNNNKIHVTTYCGLLGVRDLDPTSNIGRYANRPPTPQLHRYWYRTCRLLLVHDYTCILHQFHCLLNGLFFPYFDLVRSRFSHAGCPSHRCWCTNHTEELTNWGQSLNVYVAAVHTEELTNWGQSLSVSVVAVCTVDQESRAVLVVGSV